MEETLTPIYPTTEGIAQGRLRALVDQALRELGTAGVHEWLPPEILQTLALPTLREALRLRAPAAGAMPSSRCWRPASTRRRSDSRSRNC